MPVVVVESPAKAKTIEKYLGGEYRVLASFGHVRDLPAKSGSVDPEDNFAMSWEVASESKKHISAIVAALKEDNHLVLATDPDREGEAISWHLEETLRARKAIKPDTLIQRVVFNAITKSAVLDAMKNPREVNKELVEAYLARRALDYLVGFNLSPVLWRKLPGARSAGRVQSVSLRIIVEREIEIEAFKPREYWSITAELVTPREQKLRARLVALSAKKLGKYDIASQAEAELAAQSVISRALTVQNVEAKPISRNPAPPFMTSTLQQEASRRLGFGARETMRLAQRLYEAGHITYMRTDGIDMVPEAIAEARATIGAEFGEKYTPEKPRYYKNKAKNAQEAHECIRPTDMAKTPDRVHLSDGAQGALYKLIWKRAVASQMSNAALERTRVDIGSEDGEVVLRASGQVVVFDGFMKIYEEGRDDSSDEEQGQVRLPHLASGEALKKASVTPEQHFTQPPPRYSEATLVKRMEELGIGRPSTYASIVTTIQERDYVSKEKDRLIPQDKGRLVTIFLKNYFRKYVEYDFTAELEEELDDVSSGQREYRDVLGRFWSDFSAAIAETSELRITDVFERINEILGDYLFPVREDGQDGRLCTLCGAGKLSMKTARSGGAFIGCSNYPECRYTRSFGPPSAETETLSRDGQMLGDDTNGAAISLRTGRYGPYVQRGEASEDKPKPDRASIPKGWAVDAIDLEKALRLLALPRQIGPHPEDGEMIEAAIGRYGPYLKHSGLYANLAELDEVFTVGMNRAVEILAEKRANPGGRRPAAAKPLVELGEHPEQGGKITVMNGRYGAYVKWGKINATLPRDKESEAITLDEAIMLLKEKAAKKGKPRGGRAKKK